MRLLRNYLILFKVWLSLAIALSAVAGYILYSGTFSADLWLSALGVFLLSCSAAALNQVQERKYDALMERTRNRPVPTGRISPLKATLIASVLLVAGTVLLLSVAIPGAAFLGLANLAWYIAVYTPLKRKNYFAVLAGALNGAVPPVIGWIAAGGAITDPKILFIAFFIFTWQIPHFWMLLMLHGEDYRKAGFYDITARFSPQMMKLLLYLWIVATAVVTMFLPWFGIIAHRAVAIFIASIILLMLILFACILVFRMNIFSQKFSFVVFNIFMMVVFLAIISEEFLN